jgi:hypothetical protein
MYRDVIFYSLLVQELDLYGIKMSLLNGLAYYSEHNNSPLCNLVLGSR